ncbi:MAG TPA: hypothetical protein VIV58_31860 [Kofleriaceae bacterium]
MTIKQLVDRALAEVQQDETFTRDLYTLIASLPRTPVDPDGDAAVGRKLTERMIRAALHGMGFSVAEPSGEVCDPRPQPVAVFTNETNARYRGVKPGRLRGGRR